MVSALRFQYFWPLHQHAKPVIDCRVHKDYSGLKGEDTVSRLTGITTAVGKDPSFWVRQVVHSLLAGDTISFGSRFTLPKSTDE